MRPFLQARLFYLANPCWLSPVKRRNRWSVFAVMVNERNDSECENVLMTPLETALSLNLEEAVSIRPPPTTHPLPSPSQGFPWCWQGFLLGDDVKLYCQGQWIQCVPETTRQAVVFQQHCISFSFFLFFYFGNCHQTSVQRGNARIKYLDVNILQHHKWMVEHGLCRIKQVWVRDEIPNLCISWHTEHSFPDLLPLLRYETVRLVFGVKSYLTYFTLEKGDDKTASY